MSFYSSDKTSYFDSSWINPEFNLKSIKSSCGVSICFYSYGYLCDWIKDTFCCDSFENSFFDFDLFEYTFFGFDFLEKSFFDY